LEKDHLYAVVWWGGYEKEGAEVLLEVGFWDWYHNRWDDLVYEGSFKRIGDYRELRVDSNAVYCFKWEYPVVAPIRFLIFDYPPEEDL
jgi:hypothetical protein